MGMLGKLRGMWRRSRAEVAPPGMYVAAFGKHPGWDDHMEDLGLDTDHLVQLKNAIYWDGIKGNLDAGAWTRELAPDERLPGFDHMFLWRSVEAIDLGCMWASRDGKQRSDYPMIACVSAERVGFGPLLAEAAALLERIREHCVVATSAAEVREVINEARRELRAVPSSGQAELAEDDERALPTLAGLEPFASDPERLVRLLYHLEREFGVHERSSSTSKLIHPEPTHLRVPACEPDVPASLLLWSRVLTEATRAVPVFVCRGGQQGWIDAVVGVPGATELFPILASDSKIAPITSIPYEIDEEDRARLRRSISPA